MGEAWTFNYWLLEIYFFSVEMWSLCRKGKEGIKGVWNWIENEDYWPWSRKWASCEEFGLVIELSMVPNSLWAFQQKDKTF